MMVTGSGIGDYINFLPLQTYDVKETPVVLTPFQEKHWSEEFKTLYRAGVINSDGSLTKEGNGVAISFIIDNKLSELVEYANNKLGATELGDGTKRQQVMVCAVCRGLVEDCICDEEDED